jgi:hypothetical protein
MTGFFKRATLVLVGIVLGMAIVSGSSPWRELFRKPDTSPPAPFQRERAPDQRA